MQCTIKVTSCALHSVQCRVQSYCTLCKRTVWQCRVAVAAAQQLVICRSLPENRDVSPCATSTIHSPLCTLRFVLYRVPVQKRDNSVNWLCVCLPPHTALPLGGFTLDIYFHHTLYSVHFTFYTEDSMWQNVHCTLHRVQSNICSAVLRCSVIGFALRCVGIVIGLMTPQSYTCTFYIEFFLHFYMLHFTATLSALSSAWWHLNLILFTHFTMYIFTF